MMTVSKMSVMLSDLDTKLDALYSDLQAKFYASETVPAKDKSVMFESLHLLNQTAAIVSEWALGNMDTAAAIQSLHSARAEVGEISDRCWRIFQKDVDFLTRNFETPVNQRVDAGLAESLQRLRDG